MPEVDIFSLDTDYANEDGVLEALTQLSASEIEPAAFLYLVCRGRRKALTKRIANAPIDECDQWAELGNRALLYSFENGDWLEPDLLARGRDLWDGQLGPVSVSRAEMLLFLGGLSRHCETVFSRMQRTRAYVKTFLHLNDEPREHGFFDQGRDEQL